MPEAPSFDVAALGAQIAAEAAAKAPFADCSEALAASPDPLAAAWDVQDAMRAVLAPQRGGVGGRKAAFNGPGQWEALGLPGPAAAPVYAAQVRTSPARIPAADFRAFWFEPEIIAILGAELSGGGWTAGTVAPHVARLHPGFEVMDRRTDGNPPPLAAIANGVFNEGMVIGGPGLPPGDVEVGALHSRVTLDGEVILDRTGAAPMHPLEAVARLANHFNARGEALAAGEALLCGAHLPPRMHVGPGVLRFDCGALGVAELTLI
ncbi:hypothetical protein ACQ5SO_18625 [Rhodovulum sp. DZ06]|uniref:hypothetical protein n=1 Tax=Rhodovulum sp. DZ06 TaxID=3425126 RepID=UPI003D3586AB